MAQQHPRFPDAPSATIDAQCEAAMQRLIAFINRAAGQHKRAIAAAAALRQKGGQ
jgi:hypothetical protein